MNKIKISDQAFVRELNTSVVMDHIRLYAPLSRAELATRTGLNRSTISIIVNELISNSLKYAFLDEKKGEISIEINRDGDDGILLVVSDDGIGQTRGQQVVPEGQPVHKAAVPDRGHLQIAVVGQRHRLLQQAAACSQTARIELRQM